jgi:hypothetical protein
MPSKDGNIQFDISDIIEAVAELDKEIMIVMIAVDMHDEKIDQLANALENSPGNIPKLKFAKPFNMWCIQDPKIHNEIDNYFDLLMNYLTALRNYGYTANDAAKLADKIKYLIDIIKKEYFYFKETRRLLEANQLPPSIQPNNLEQLINHLGGILAKVDPILGDLYECGGKIDEAMKHFLALSAQDDTYIMKLLQKLKQYPELKAWCKPWAINWDDSEEETNPLKTALAALPPLCVEVISYEQGNRSTAFTIS